jgi:hypothetical protein
MLAAFRDILIWRGLVNGRLSPQDLTYIWEILAASPSHNLPGQLTNWQIISWNATSIFLSWNRGDILHIWDILEYSKSISIFSFTKFCSLKNNAWGKFPHRQHNKICGVRLSGGPPFHPSIPSSVHPSSLV